MKYLKLFENYDNWYDDTVFMYEGQPQIFYHGTKHQEPIVRFKVGRKGLRGGMIGSWESETMGNFFTINRQDADGYAGSNGRVVQVHIKSHKPLFVMGEEIGSWRHWENMPQARKKELAYIFEPMIQMIKNDDGNDEAMIEFGFEAFQLQPEWLEDMSWLIRCNQLGTSVISEGGVNWRCMDVKEVNERMIERGFDSVMVYEPDHETDFSQCIFNPDNIRIINQ